MIRQYFPLGKAYGRAFCNREEETTWLLSNIKSVKHSLVIAPRRYGKSSLAEKAMAAAKMPFVNVNFHLCTTEQEVADLIINNVTKLIGKAVGQIEKMTTSIKKYVSNLNPKISVGRERMTLELVSKQNANLAETIAESLLLVENLLREKNKKAIIFFDEFQEIYKISQSAYIEGAIRTAAQEMQNLSLIFSGSLRSLLVKMFDDEKRPLYKLCRKLRLDRISSTDYKRHLNKIAAIQWGRNLDDEVFDQIMQLSLRHPYYLNYLCDVLWEISTDLPKIKDVQMAWQQVVEEEWSDLLKDLSILSPLQKKVLKFIALNPNQRLLGQDSIMAMQMTPSSISSSISALLEKDYIEKDEEGHYWIINPLLLTILRE